MQLPDRAKKRREFDSVKQRVVVIRQDDPSEDLAAMSGKRCQQLGLESGHARGCCSDPGPVFVTGRRNQIVSGLRLIVRRQMPRNSAVLQYST